MLVWGYMLQMSRLQHNITCCSCRIYNNNIQIHHTGIHHRENNRRYLFLCLLIHSAPIARPRLRIDSVPRTVYFFISSLFAKNWMITSAFCFCWLSVSVICSVPSQSQPRCCSSGSRRVGRFLSWVVVLCVCEETRQSHPVTPPLTPLPLEGYLI